MGGGAGDRQHHLEVDENKRDIWSLGCVVSDGVWGGAGGLTCGVGQGVLYDNANDKWEAAWPMKNDKWEPALCN